MDGRFHTQEDLVFLVCKNGLAGSLLTINRSIDWKQAEFEEKIREKCEAEAAKPDGDALLAEFDDAVAELQEPQEGTRDEGTTVSQPGGQEALPGPTDGQGTAGAQTVTATAADRQTEAARNRRARDAAEALSGSMTDEEINFFRTGTGVEQERVTGQMLVGPLNPDMTPEKARAYAVKTAEEAENNYVASALKNYGITSRFEKWRETEANLIAERDKIQEQWGDRLYVRESLPSTVSITNEDGIELSAWLCDDGVYRINGMDGEHTPDVQERLDGLNGYARQILDAKEKYGEEIPEDMPTLEYFEDLEDQINQLGRQIVEHQAEYEQADKENLDTWNRFCRVHDAMTRNGDGELTNDPEEVTNTMLGFMQSFYGYTTPDREGMTTAEQFSEQIRAGKASAGDIDTQIGNYNTAIANVRYCMEQYPNIPDEYGESMLQYIADAEAEIRQYELLKFSMSPEFEKSYDDGVYAIFGEKNLPDDPEEFPQIGNTRKDFFAGMTDFERRMYFALYGRDGAKAADEYYDQVHENIKVRLDEGIRADAAERAKDWSGRLLNLGIGIGTVVAEIPASMLNILTIATQGKGSDLLTLPGKISKISNEENMRALDEAYKDNPLALKVVKGMYEIGYNRGRSALTALTFGGIFSGVSNEIVQAFPLGLTAMNDTLTEALDNEVEPWKAWILATISFAGETVTEGIEFGHINEAIELGKGAGKSAVMDWLRGYIPNAMAEVIGECSNDIVDTMADYILSGDHSEVNTLAKRYEIEEGLSPDAAMAKAWEDKLGDVAHTAAISFFSGAADIVSLAGSYVKSHGYYAKQARYMSNLTGQKITVNQLRNGDYQAMKAEERAKALREKEAKAAGKKGKNSMIPAPALPAGEQAATEQEAETAEEETAPADEEGAFAPDEETLMPEEEEARKAEEAAQARENRMYGNAIAALWSASGANASGQHATMTAIFQTTDSDAHRTNAASAGLFALLGNDTVDTVQGLMDGGQKAGIGIGALNKGLQYAALADGACRDVVTSQKFRNATTEEQARMLSDAVLRDATDEKVKNEVRANVRQHRIIAEEQRLLAEGAGEEAVKSQQKIQTAGENTQAAKDALGTKQAETDAARQGVADAAEEVQRDPKSGEPIMRAATEKLEGATAVEQEHERMVEKQEQNEAAVREEEGRNIENTMAGVRAEATQNVDTAIAEEDRAAAEAEQLAAEQRAEQERQAAEEREKANLALADAEAFVEKYYPDATDEQKQTILNMMKTIKREATGEAMLDRAVFAHQLAKKFGLKIRIADTVSEDGLFSNGYVDPETREITLDRNSTISDIMYKVLGHELTHIAELSGTYSELADALLQIRYGDDASYAGILEQIKAGKANSQLAADILGRKSLYDQKLGREHTPEYALQEIVADLMGDMFYGKDGGVNTELVSRLADERPSVARRILDSIKSFLKKLTGYDDPALNQAKQVVDMLENALRNTKEKQSAENDMRKKFLIQDASPHLIDQIREASETLNKMAPVKSVSSKTDFSAYSGIAQDRQAQIKLWAKDKADSFGRNLYREGFGYTELSNSAIKTIFSYLGYTNDAAIAAFEALPDVYKNGMEIHSHKDHKGRGVESYTFAAPIEVDGERGNMGLIVRRSRAGTNFKTYKVVLPNGKEFVIRNEKAELAPQAGSEEATRTDSVSEENITQESAAVKPLISDESGDDLAVLLPGESASVNTVKHSLSSFTPEEQANVRKALLNAKGSDGKKLFTPEQVDHYMKDALGIASVIAADRDRLDFEASDVHTMLKPNQEYKYTVDASTLCAKRLLYQGTFDAIQHLLPNTPLMPEDLIDLSNMMREMGYETPCGICYVESRRRHLDKFAKGWLDKYKGEYKPTLDQVTSSDGLEQLRQTHPQAYQDFVDAMNKKGVANPKVVQLRTEYRGEIRDLHPTTIRNLINHGGLRLQSFSDFEVPHLLDMVQVVMDMASKKLTSQAYTKVPNFAWVFGDTGVKINLSLIGKGTGLDANGNLLFDDVEGMPFEEAMKLRNRYSKNVGTILVGINDDHIIAAMADDRIDFIIPFHKSGWSQEELNRMPVLNGYSDYTNSQNEKKIKERKADGSGYEVYSADDYKMKNLEPVGQNGYWDFSKTGTENAETYLRLCAEDGRVPKFSQFLVDNGDGSFSLPEGDDARSAAIRKGYWKTLIDFKMYDNDGVGSPQTAVTPNINMNQASRVLNEYSLDRNGISRKNNNDLPVAQPVVDRYVEEYKKNHPLDETRTRYSLPEEQNNTEGDTGIPNALRTGKMGNQIPSAGNSVAETMTTVNSDAEYQSAVERGDIETATEMLMQKLRETQGVIPFMTPNMNWHTGENRKIAEKLKTNGPEAISKAAKEMAKCVPNNAVLIPMPGSGGKVEDGSWTMNLTNAIAELTGRPVVVALEGSEHESRQKAKHNGEVGPLQEDLGFRKIAEIPEGTIPIFIDNTVGSGVTADAARIAMGGGITLAYTKTLLSKGIPGLKNAVVTYESKKNGGGLIPLSQRFDVSKRDVRYSLPADAPYMAAVERGEGDQYALSEDLANSTDDETRYGERRKFSLRVTDPKELEFLDNQETITTYKTMQYIDGKLYPPMAAVVAGGVEDYSELGAWEKATEHPELIKTDKKGKTNFTLNKGGGKGSLDARYNPYMHSSNLMINDQFTGAYDRPNLVTVECEVPVSESDGAYHAEYAKDSTGWHGWHAGPIAGALRQEKGVERQVFLSRWIKPVRIVPDSEVAAHYAGLVDGTSISVPDNVVYPALLEELEKAGVPIKNSGKVPGRDARFSLPSDDILEKQIRQYIANGGVSNGTGTQNGIALPPAGGDGSQLPGMPGMGAQRQFGHQTAQGSNALHQEVKDYLYSHSTYTPDSNQAQIDRAVGWVQGMAREGDEDGYRGAVNEVTSPTFDYRSADGQARMLTVMGMAALKGDVETEMRIADAYNQQGTDLGRQLQARKLFRMMTPVGRMSVLEGMVRKTNEEYARRTGNDLDLTIDPLLLQAAAMAEDEGDMRKVRQAAAKQIAEQLPANWRDRMRSWRMLSMLGNPRTHIRNVLGNFMFVPVVSLKNKLGAAAEIVTRQGEGQRTKTLRPVLPKEIRDFAKADALAMKDELTGEAKYNEDTLVEREKRGFKGVMQVIADFNSNMLEKEDWRFLKGHYQRALGGWMDANGYTAEQVKANPELLEQGRTYAIGEAQKATYRDFSKIASQLNQISRSGGVLGFVTDAALPFKKTPANILKRGMEYSPIGIARALTADALRLKQYNDFQKGKLKALPEKALSPSQFIDRVCSGLTGSAIMAIGALLGNMGAATVGLDDDEDEFEKLKGNQKYAIKFNLFGNDVTFTMDWAAPVCMPFFTGVALAKQMRNENGWDIDQVVNAFGNISEPVFNLSMLDGVNSLLGVSSYGDDGTNTLTQIAAKIGTNYMTSYVPSLAGAVARTIDPYRRKAFVKQGEGTGIMGTLRYAREQVENKIPGLSQTNIPYRDVWGNPDESGLGERILENFLLPGYANQYKSDDPVVNELERLYGTNPDPALVPQEPKKSFTANKEKKILEAEQWDAYKAARGQAAHGALEGVFQSEYYQNASPEEKTALVKKVWDYADAVGKNAAVGTELPEWISNGKDPVEHIIEAQQTKQAEAAAKSHKEETMAALDQGNYEGYEAMRERLREDGVDDDKLRGWIYGAYRDKYKDAYLRGDEVAMDEIREKVEASKVVDLTKKNNILEQWEKDAEKNRPQTEAGAGGPGTGSTSSSGGGGNRNGLTLEQEMYQTTEGPTYGKGNIDLNSRQVVQNEDGTISTERSMSFYDEEYGMEVLIPTVVNGRVVSDDEAIDHYYETGELLGLFRTPEEADQYAEMLHERQDWYYNRYKNQHRDGQ